MDGAKSRRTRARSVTALATLAAGVLGGSPTARTGTPGRVVRRVADTLEVPAGEFTMGASPEHIRLARDLCRREPGADGPMARACLADTFPTREPACDLQHFALEYGAHRVWLRAFAIDRTEVTVADYQRCVQRGACAPVPVPTDADTLPVTHVRWDDAVAFCRHRHGRLPSEAEWERAARGRDGRPFPWGFLWDPRRANHGALVRDCRDAVADGYEGPAPVGSYPDGASPDGALDMAGNVAEWVDDLVAIPGSIYPGTEPDAGPPARVVDPHGPSNGAGHLVRGGAFDSPAFALRATYRATLASGERRDTVGFRCAYDR